MLKSVWVDLDQQNLILESRGTMKKYIIFGLCIWNVWSEQICASSFITEFNYKSTRHDVPTVNPANDNTLY